MIFFCLVYFSTIMAKALVTDFKVSTLLDAGRKLRLPDLATLNELSMAIIVFLIARDSRRFASKEAIPTSSG